MLKRQIALLPLILLSLALSPAAGDQPPRIMISIGEVTVTRDDSLAVVPVTIVNPYDTVAGVDLYFTIEPNEQISFASDDVGAGGLLMAVDTAGTLSADWEWLAANSLRDDFYNVKFVGMADWPDDEINPPLVPQSGGVLVNLVCRLYCPYPVMEDTRVPITLVAEKSSLSDAFGNSIGIVTTIERHCTAWSGDSCISWRSMRVGRRDTAVIGFHSGAVAIVDTVSIPGEE